MRPQLFRGHTRTPQRRRLAQLCAAAALLCVGVAMFYAWPARPSEIKDARPHAESARERAPAVSVEEADARLRSAASTALAGREGTVVVMDAQTGRVRAAVRPELAATAALPPGSAVKPFTLLAALRSGAVDPHSRLACRRHFTRPGVEFSCAHPVFRPPFDAEQALAHSCNYYFARLGERLDADDFNRTLASFGFGPRDANDGRQHSTPDTDQHHPRTRDTRPRTETFDQRHSQQSTAPRLPRAPLRTETALGEGDALLVTPLQLLSAYAALFNGGRLLEPQHAAPSGFRARELSRLEVSGEERALLVAALRGAVKYGTAEAAKLDELPLRVFGKTGTATEIGGFRTDGWFVGFASAPNATRRADDPRGDTASGNTTGDDPPASARARADQPAPSEVGLAVLVFLRRSQGKQAAAASRAVFAEYARLTHDGAASQNSAGDARNSFDPSNDAGATANDFEGSPSPRAQTLRDPSALTVRVRTSRDSAPVAMPLEEYLFGALAGEASTEDEFAALKAQAVVSRTYALKHTGRHAREGFDFCATTHCQRYLRVTSSNSRPDFHAALRRAISETSGETLRDARGRIINAYFSASCGGMTADVETLWGTPAREPYERGVRDEFCTAAPHARWTDRVPARRLLTALREDARSDVGARLDQITVVKRDRTGRAELVAVAGERRRILRGWDFKIIVGRALGWSVVKSSRFTVAREGADFVFRGSGFGHGLGLCQHGAHTLARRGASHLQILSHYFPGAAVSRANASDNQTTSTRAPDPTWHADATAPLDTATREADNRTDAHSQTFSLNFFAAPRVPSPRLTLASANFRVHYPANQPGARREVESTLRTLEAARADLLRRLSAASIPAPALPTVEVFAHETTGDFVASTGQPAWVAAATRGTRVELQPLATLGRRRILPQTLRHELAHVFVSAVSHGRAPRWLTEGLAAHFAGEGPQLSRHAPRQKFSFEELEARLARPASSAEMRALYAAAYREVAALVRAEGESSVWQRAARS
jgi:stage II sporulation protein D